MAKKRRTKEQKIISSLRRQLNQRQPAIETVDGQKPEKDQTAGERKDDHKNGAKSEALISTAQVGFIKKDLVKTTLTSILFLIAIILIRLFLYPELKS